METISIWKSRRFWLAIMDAILGVATTLLSVYLPDIAPLVLKVYGYLQVPISLVIVAFTIDDTIKNIRSDV